MRKLLAIGFILASFTGYSQTSLVHTIATKVQLKALNTSATKVFVSDSNSFYSICSPCTVDDIYIIAGQSGKKWKKVAGGNITINGSTIDTSSLSNRVNLKVNISDTSAMLSKYLRKLDTAALSTRINAKVNIADTAGMLNPYLRKLDTAALSTRINTKVNISDTAAMLSGYDRSTDAVTATRITQDATHRFATDAEKTSWNAKQSALVSGTNIKTVNGNSLLGSGDVTIAGGGGGGSSTLAGLTDVTLTSPTSGNNLSYDYTSGKWINKKPAKYNVKDYLAQGDGQQFFDGNITAASSTFTSTAGHFTSADVGKTIEIVGAGTAGRRLVTTISAYGSATSITLATPAVTTVSGIKFAYGTDDQQHIQDAINACFAGGGGTVYFPNGVYFIAGALVNDVGQIDPNCQLYIPAVADQYSLVRTHIVLEGETPPHFAPAGMWEDLSPTYKGVVLKSTISGTGIAPSVIGTKGPGASYQSMNYQYVSMKNLTILVAPNPTGTGPTMTGINMFYIASLFGENLLCVIDGSLKLSTLPSAESAGIICTQNNGEAHTRLVNTLCEGFRYGLITGDHADIDNTAVFACWAGLVPMYTTQAMHGNRVNAHWCVNTLYVPNGSIMNGLIVAGQTFFNIDLLNVEAATSKITTDVPGNPVYWFFADKIIRDDGNRALGSLTYHILETLNQTPRPDLFSKSGGTGLICSALGSDPVLWHPVTGGAGYQGGRIGVNTTTPETVAHFKVTSGAAMVTPETTDPVQFSGLNLKTDQGIMGQVLGMSSSYPTGTTAYEANSLVVSSYHPSGGINLITQSSRPIKFFVGPSGLASEERFRITTNTLTTGNSLGIGSISFTPSAPLHIKVDQNDATLLKVENATDGSSSVAGFRFISDAGRLYEGGIRASSASAYGALAPASAYNYAATPAGFVFMNDNASGNIQFAPGGNATRFTFKPNGDFNIATMAGTGDRMVVTHSDGTLSNQAIPVVTTYTDEQAQDAIGSMITSEFTYTDATPALAINTIAQSKVTGLTSALAAKADLVGGIVPTGQLPASVVAIVTVANFAALPGTGAANTIYITSDNNKRYIYTTSYVELGATVPVTSVNALTGDVVLTSASVGAVPTTRTLSINGTSVDLSANRTWSVGTVTTAAVSSANGFTGSVSNPTTTPAISIGTSLSGMLKGTGTGIATATSGTDYSGGTSALSTGILKSTAVTGALTIAVAGDFPTLNQNTTGTAANITGVLNATSFPALTGDVTNTSGSVATTIANNVVTVGKMQQIPTSTVLGRTTAGTGNVEVLTNFPVGLMPALTGGDVTSSAGSGVLTLGTVNSNTGTWGTATQVPTFSVNGKGLITGVAHTSIAIPASQLTATGTKDATTYLAGDNTWKTLPTGGSGTVTGVSVVTANGFAGTATSTATPAITLTTSVTGILKGNGTAMSAAIASDFPTLNQNTTGTAANLTAAAALPSGTTATTQSPGNNSAAIASTAYVDAADALKANLASPTFTGTPTLPTGTIATTQTAANSSTAIATTAFVENAITRKSYNTIAEASASHIAARVAGTYALGDGDPAAISGTGTLYPIKIIRINAADYPTVDGITTKLSLQINLAVNDVAPTGNYTFGLYPITRPATSGGAGLDIYTLGTVTTNSTVLFTAPAADGLLTGTSVDFALPADGFYVIGFISTAAVATSSHLHMTGYLRYRNN